MLRALRSRLGGLALVLCCAGCPDDERPSTAAGAGTASAAATTPPPPSPQPSGTPRPTAGVATGLSQDEAAARGLSTIQKLGKEFPAGVGLDDKKQADHLQLGSAYEVDVVTTTALTSWAAHPSLVPPILNPSKLVIYSIDLVDSQGEPQPKTALTVGERQAGSDWLPLEYGNGPLGKDMAAAQAKWPFAPRVLIHKPPGLPRLPSPLALTYVPALHLYLLHTRPTLPAGKAQFTPVRSVAGFKAGEKIATDVLFKRLIKALPAHTSDGKPF